MHILKAALLAFMALTPSTLARQIRSRTEQITPEVEYYYKSHNLALDTYKPSSSDTMQEQATKMISCSMGKMDCGTDMFCDLELMTCMTKVPVGMSCHSNEGCTSGVCGNANMCVPKAGEYGSHCMDPSMCKEGMTCRYGMMNMDHMECLDMVKGAYGADCAVDNDCNAGLYCRNMDMMDGKGSDVSQSKMICMTMTGMRSCKPAGLACGNSSQCCSGRCLILAGTVIPRCV
ncbi:hypothetical protein N7532_000377 [Penicillium argentinense]|uniref:Uncharacterized protein n=1 Tax=Penicillium argentinense TaxID=1131581 RepID=A0A9W9G5E1_9EURO|nr:uncharacterized protein N7532_000377 [Penicillium argentinense]KAJ5112332.1 hypothetical protein N7532_000377 [Penicillium argentinense]